MNAFTAEELAELAAFDAAVDAEPLTQDEVAASRVWDDVARACAIGNSLKDGVDKLERRRAKDRERYRTDEGRAQRKAYWEANRERLIADQKRRYRENRETRLAWQKAYYARTRSPAVKPTPEEMRRDQPYIKVWRLKAGLSQTEVARMAGVSASTIGVWEQGKRPAKWDKLARAGCIKP